VEINIEEMEQEIIESFELNKEELAAYKNKLQFFK